jgi:uncharacterized protein
VSCDEAALQFDCAGETLLGIVSRPLPGAPLSGAAVLVIVGGPQYRAGSHRQFVQLARCLAAAGHVVLRFDYRGMGDSSGTARNFENVSADVGRALDMLQQQAPQARSLVLFGLCDGASAALLYLQETSDRRVGGLCLLNPWARSDSTLARTHLKHYYLQRLGQRAFWSKLLRGGVGLARLSEFVQSLKTGYAGRRRQLATGTADRSLPFQERMARGWRAFEHGILLALSGNDLTAQEFVEHAAGAPSWRGLLQRPQVARVELPGADHTLSEPAAQRRFEEAVLGWLSTLRPAH